MSFIDPAEATSELVIERLIAHWRRPPEAGKGYQFDYNDLAPSAVLELLLREFSLLNIRTAMATCLLQTADTLWQDASTTRRQNFVTDGCLRLARDVPSLSLMPELVRELIYKVDSILGLTLLGPQVARHLSEAQLIDALTHGVQTATAEFPRSSCLAGLGLYYPYVKRRSDIPTLERSLNAFEREVRRLRTQDAELLSTVQSARKAVWRIRRIRAELPKPSNHAFIAYRVEQEQSDSYSVERREDGELAVAITRFELSERTLTIEYECFDPQLLPENAPDVIEVSLLQGYAEDAYLTLVDEAVFVDIYCKQTRRRRLSVPTV